MIQPVDGKDCCTGEAIPVVHADDCRRLERELTALRAELSAARKDAERLDWLANRHDNGDEQWFVYGAKSDEPLRAEIDKEMSK